MAESKTTKLEREYVIPLRREWLLVPKYRRAGRAAKALKQFIAKHMKIPERDTKKVKLDVYLNQELWFKGRRNPPSKIKVRAIKDGDIVKVELAEMPQIVKFAKARHEKRHKKAEEKPKEAKTEEKKEEIKPEAKTPEEKKEKEEEKKVEVEKEKSVEQEKLKQAKQEKRAEKHLAKDKKVEFARRSMSRH